MPITLKAVEAQTAINAIKFKYDEHGDMKVRIFAGYDEKLTAGKAIKRLNDPIKAYIDSKVESGEATPETQFKLSDIPEFEVDLSTDMKKIILDGLRSAGPADPEGNEEVLVEKLK